MDGPLPREVEGEGVQLGALPWGMGQAVFVDGPLPRAQLPLSLYTVSPGPLPPPPTTVFGVNR